MKIETISRRGKKSVRQLHRRIQYDQLCAAASVGLRHSSQLFHFFFFRMEEAARSLIVRTFQNLILSSFVHRLLSRAFSVNLRVEIHEHSHNVAELDLTNTNDSQTTNTTPSFKVRLAACDVRLLIGHAALKGKGSFGERSVGRMIILKWILDIWSVMTDLNSCVRWSPGNSCKLI